ncbi:hypothetical protein [Gaoshiqia sp. Z1-71]|uniref:hypothetical protein n=1 Tax=Gaoshiqia hydrogeniformans TaxID=3290090 RepID=UPI003BF7DD5D
MKKLIYFLLTGLLLVNCSNDDSFISSADRNVVSDDRSVSFEELLILINLKSTDSTYLVVKSIDSVNIFINNYYWAKINSQTLDTSKVDKFLVGNKYQSRNKINYLVIANQDIEQPAYETAGEFARYLNAAYELKPGEYACLIESFQLTFSDLSTKKYFPHEYAVFKVEQNSRSAFAGEIEIKLN